MNDEYFATCNLCGKTNPVECSRIDCPMESYFWTEDDEHKAE